MPSEYFIVVIEIQEIGDLQQDFEEKKCKLKEDVIELNEDLQKLDRDYTDKLKIIQNKKEKAREKQQKVLSTYCRVWFNMSLLHRRGPFCLPRILLLPLQLFLLLFPLLPLLLIIQHLSVAGLFSAMSQLLHTFMYI